MLIFVYGTLRDDDLRKTVLGDEGPRVRAAWLEGVRALMGPNGQGPYLHLNADSKLYGDLIQVTPDQQGRLAHYEGVFGFELEACRVFTAEGVVEAHMYSAAAKPDAQGQNWDLTGWRRRWGPLIRLAAEEVMDHFGHRPPEQIAPLYPTLLMRAASRLQAQTTPVPRMPGASGFTSKDVRIIDRRMPYVNFFALAEYDLSFPEFGGGHSDTVTRAAFVGADASIVLPYDPARDRVMLVEQFRTGPLVRGDQHPWSLEPIAGRIDPGDTPENTARREAQEEAGLTLTHLEKIAACYPSPGCSTEFFHIFVGLADLPDDVTGVAGLDSEAEDIKSHLISLEDLLVQVDRHAASNAPLVLATLWLARHRDRLRRAQG